MLFNSLDFAMFLPVVFILYWFATKGNLKFQNILLLASSYFFYACWDYRFLFLLIFSTLLDYYTGIKISEGDKKKFWFWLSICINLGFLGVFKYYNFFIASFADGLSLMGIETDVWILSVILPVGISFYTFHGLSYVIDIYKDRIKPERNFINYSVFVSFFPLLVAGPIERATHLLPQIQKERKFNYSQATDGLRQILWGLFKKVIIADKCAVLVNDIFLNHESYSGLILVLGSVLFALQIYCDFSGYSDIALGTARLFGIELLRNFAFPYFSRDIAEFWRRWHISLSSWFRDYLYIPLGGSKVGKLNNVRNVFVVFLLSGFWHGANWTFIAWGALHAIYFVPLLLLGKNRENIETVAQGNIFPAVKDFLQIVLTFSLVCFAWIFFRAQTLSESISYIQSLIFNVFLPPKWGPINFALFCFIVILIFFEWVYRDKKFGFDIRHWNVAFRWLAYLLITCILFFYNDNEWASNFIYFQF